MDRTGVPNFVTFAAQKASVDDAMHLLERYTGDAGGLVCRQGAARRGRVPLAFPREIAAQVERIYRAVYLLATLQRDEMIRDGRQKELEKVTNAASKAEASTRAELEKRLQPRS